MSTELAPIGGQPAQPAADGLTQPQQDGGMFQTPSHLQLPAYLQEQRALGQPAEGVEELREYYVPPRFKIVQAQSKQELVDLFGVGAGIVVPSNIPVAKYEEQFKRSNPFTFIPIFTFKEYGIVNPRNVKNPETGADLPFMRERTYDPKSEIAKRAKDFQNKENRYETCPESKDPNKRLRFVEFLNFICIIEGVPDLYMMPVHFSFWSTGHADGRALANYILARTGVPLYAQRFQGTVTPRNNAEGNWKGLTVQIPQVADSFVQSAEECEFYRQKHVEVKQMFNERKMQVDHEDEPVGDNVIEVPANAEY